MVHKSVMRILLVTSRYLPHRGGLETVVSHIAQEFQQRGHEVLIIASRYPRSLPEYEVINGIRVRRLQFLYPQMRFLRTRRIDLFLGGFWFVVHTSWRLHKVIRRFKPDVVNLHYLGSTGLFLWLQHLWSEFLWVISLHGGDVDGEPHRSRFKAWLFRASLSRADMVTVCSNHLADQVRQLAEVIEDKTHVIHNGVEWKRFIQAQPYRHERSYIAAVGQLVEHKGFDLLIEAFAEVEKHFPDVDVLIAGEGEHKRKLKTLIHARGLEDRIHLLGRIDEGEVASLMNGSLFVAMPSRREPFGIVALEGMAAARHVLTTPVGGIPEFLSQDVNWMVEPRLEPWIRALSECLVLTYQENNVEVPSNQIRAKNLSWKVVASEYLSTYHDTLSRVVGTTDGS